MRKIFATAKTLSHLRKGEQRNGSGKLSISCDTRLECMINKELVKNSFKKNLRTYDENAFVQKVMAENLTRLIPAKKFKKVLEIGIGTGFFTKLLAEKIDYEEFFANDIVSECSNYLSQIIKGAIFVNGDIEDVKIPKGLDLVVSNATFQWINDSDDIFSKISSSLNPDADLVFSTFGVKNFIELKDSAHIGLDYLPHKELESLLNKYFEIIEIRVEEQKVCFKKFRDILKHIKLTGVNGISNKRYTITELKEIEQRYSEKYKQDKGFVLTYNPIYVHVRKRP